MHTATTREYIQTCTLMQCLRSMLVLSIVEYEHRGMSSHRSQDVQRPQLIFCGLQLIRLLQDNSDSTASSDK